MKKPILVASIILISGLLVAGGLYGKRYLGNRTPIASPTPTTREKELVLWEDPAGFSFQYPKSLTLDKHDEDMENYAHLEFTSPQHTGAVIVWAKDTTYKNVTDWVDADPAMKNAISVDTTLGGISAKKIVINGTAKKMITGAIDDEILFTIEVDPGQDESFWQDVYTDMTTTFTFINPTSDESDSVSASSVEEAGVDEEEVLE